MNTSKKYHDSEGNECSIWQAVRLEPDWAASRIQEGEKAIANLEKLKAASEKIKHWHCSDNGGMIVSAKSVHELWEVLKELNK